MKNKRSFFAILVVALLLPSVVLAGTITLTFSSGPDWKTFSNEPGPTSFIGSAAAVCINEAYPSPCPSGAVLYGYPFGGWSADLSPIPGAVWIWAPKVNGDTAPAEFASYFFSNTFILDGLPTAGVINIAADDFAEIRVNEMVVGTIGSLTDVGIAGDAQSYLHQFDILSFLKPGKNVITIHAQNGAAYFSGICGVACSYSQNVAGVVFGGSMQAVPEAPTLALVCLGFAGLVFSRRRQCQMQKVGSNRPTHRAPLASIADQ